MSSSNLVTTTKFAKLSNQSSPIVEIHQGYWTRKEVESQTDKVFLFGDNTDDRINTHYIPSRTQAVIRGLDNAIGIDTKKNRGISESSYFTDADFDIFKAQVNEAIQHAIDSGKIIVIPADGIGTGKAELDKRAPKLFAYLQQRLDELKKLNSLSSVQFDDSIDILEESVAEEPVTIGFDNTDERVDNSEKSDTVEENLSEVTLSINTTTPIYQTTPSKQSKLIEVIRQANEKGVKGIHIVSHSDLINEDIYIRSANGFVRNGEIYINVDRAGDDTVIHEFGHLYLADAKNNNRLAYYALLEKVKDTEL